MHVIREPQWIYIPTTIYNDKIPRNQLRPLVDGRAVTTVSQQIPFENGSVILPAIFTALEQLVIITCEL
jgi:hypothetical protein